MNLDRKFEYFAIGLAICCVLIGFVCLVVNVAPVLDDTLDGTSQFVLIGDEGLKDGYLRVMFFVDTKTGVEYVMVGGEMTPRYNTNGSLINHPEYITEEK